MQAALQGESGLIVQYPREPVFVFENQLAGEENGVGKFDADFFGLMHQFFNRVGAEGGVALGGEAVDMAKAFENNRARIRRRP